MTSLTAEKTLYVTDRLKWRRWLKRHYRTDAGVWLVYYRKASAKPRIPYGAAVEEALCFGWIDSTVRKLDDDRFAQRFSPRKAGSAYSEANKQRLRRLAAGGKVEKEILATLGNILHEDFVTPTDILRAIKANKTAWANFQRFSDSYKRIRIGFIQGARRRPQEFQKRLNYFIKMTEKNRQFGFGGIEKYY